MASKCRKSVRKAGTRMGQPHYSAECATCRTVLAIGHLSKDAAERRFAEHAAAVANR